MSLREFGVLVSQLPEGSRLRKARGGAGAWSDTVAAVYSAGHRIVAAALLAGGAKKSDIPDPPKPPVPGWREIEREKAEREQRRAARHEARARA